MNKGGKIILAVICKDENDYIEEFVDYHLNIGFDKIIIGDNNDISGELYQEQLKDYIKAKQVKIYNLRGKKGQQKVFYNMVMDKEDYEWCAFIDADEFITFGPQADFSDIRDFLESNDNIKAYKLNWCCYGDNGKIHMEDEDVIDRFPEPKPMEFTFTYNFPENLHTKSILHKSVQNRFFNSPHTVDYYDGYYTPSGIKANSSPVGNVIDWAMLYVRHYYTKSLEEWVKHKMGRGYADVPLAPPDGTYRLDDYFKYNEKTPEKINYLKSIGIDYE